MDFSITASPTLSNTTSTPLPPVSFITTAEKSSRS